MNARLLLPFLFAAATAPVTAQFALDKITNGTLGQNLRLDFAGATPGKTLVTIPSTTQGPIPLGWFSAGDTRVLEVGFIEVVVWRLSEPLSGSTHSLKYRLAYVVAGECVLRYDNEAGKGDHRHVREKEHEYRFKSVEQLLDDFWNDVEETLK